MLIKRDEGNTTGNCQKKEHPQFIITLQKNSILTEQKFM